MKLHNTLTRLVEEFKPIKADTVSLYTCGPTVYSYYHIGNLRNAVFNDTLRRTLEASSYNVKHVMNITDVGHLDSDADEGEDKLEAGAKKDNKSVWDVAKFYIEAFKSDMAALNVLPPNGYSGPEGPYARATDFIPQQVELVKTLIDKGFAYQTDEAIYFDVSKLPSYGELSGQKLSEKEVGAREEVVKDAQKRNPQDFALWFFTVGRFAGHSMHWPTPWGDGFPGWHLECSAIIHATLSDPIDIHTGGVDHIGTHHPNEMAQTEAAFGHKLANYWVHNEHMLIDGRKMSKSLGNAYTLADVIEKGYPPEVLRLLFLQSHYRTQSNFDWDELVSAYLRLLDLRKLGQLIHQPNIVGTYGSITAEQIDDFKNQLLKTLQNDLNTPEFLSTLGTLDGYIRRERLKNKEAYASYTALIDFIDQALGLQLAREKTLTENQQALVNEQEKMWRSIKQSGSDDFSASDAMRKKLSDEHKINIENYNEEGSLWTRF